MKKLLHQSDRNQIIRDNVPTVGDQLDAIWNILRSDPKYKDAVENDPVFKAIKELKTKYPKMKQE